MNDDRSEREIRSMLAGRDPGPAPARLQRAVREVPLTVGRTSGWNRLSVRLAPIAAVLGTVAVLVAVVVAIGVAGIGRVGPVPAGLGGSPGPAASWVAFDPTADGSGIAAAPNDIPISLVIVACGVVAVATMARPRARRIRRAAGVVIGLVLISVFALRYAPLVRWVDGAYAPGLGYVGPKGDLVSDTGIFAVGPYGVLTYGFDLTNTGPLPIDLVGLAPDPVGGAWAVGMAPSQSRVGAGSIRVTAVGLLRDQNLFSLLPADTRPWERVHVAAGERTFLVFAARAGPCALGRDNRGDGMGSDDVLEKIGVVYDVLGVETMATVTLPMPIAIPRVVNGCAAS